MVSEENRTGLYVTVPAYFGLLVLAAFWAYRRTEVQKSDGVNDQLSAHYLGGRGFGPLLTAGTLFASLFSGYTVVGIPNEAYRAGFRALRWMPSLCSVVAGFFGTGLRLHKTSHMRNHQSPTDFITDRFQSQIVRYTVFTMQFLPALIYLAGQVVAIKGTFNGIFELDADTMYPVVIIMTLIIIFEWVGGLNSVALTDSIQAVVMVASFLAIPSVILKNFGGWSDLDPETYPKPEFYQTLSKENQWVFWQFGLVNFSFFGLPHLMQRTYAAKDLMSLKAGYTVMTIGPWFTCFVGVFLGTVGVSMLADEDGNATTPANPFSAILEEVMSLGGFGRVSGCIAVTASLAAIMSTADSLIIAISQLVTEEIIYPLRPQASKAEIHLYGKAMSLISSAIALLVGTYWDDGISDLAAVQFALSAQAFPAFIFGLFSCSRRTELHPYTVASAAISGAIVVFAVYFGYMKDNSDAIAFSSAFQGIVTQIVVVAIVEPIFRLTSSDPELAENLEKGDYPALLYPNRPAWDIPNTAKYGEHALTPQFMWEHMKGLNEPLANPWWALLITIVMSSATIVSPEFEPPLAPEGSASKFLYPVSLINGLPWWAFSSILHSALATFLLLFAIYNMPSEIPDVKKTELKEFVDDDEEDSNGEVAEDVVKA